MTTHVIYREYGFTVVGIKPGLEDLGAMVHFIGADGAVWADKARTSLFVSCNTPQVVWYSLARYLEEHNLCDWDQQASFVPLDNTLTAICFSACIPGGSMNAYSDHEGIHDVFMGGKRILVLMREPKVSDELWQQGQQAVWQHLRSKQLSNKDSDDLPLRPLPALDESGQVVQLEEGLVAIRTTKVLAGLIDQSELLNRHLNSSHFGQNAMLLAGGPCEVAGPVKRYVQPNPFEVYMAMGRAVGLLVNKSILGPSFQTIVL